MIERYLRGLGDELRRRGVGGRDRARVLAETEDHLRELAAEHGEQSAVSRFGESARLARDIAAQLATTRTVRSTYGAFVSLALTGAAYLGFFAAINLGGGWPDIADGQHAVVGVLVAIGVILFPQIAFVAGCLAVLRALRLRGRGTLPAQELGVMRTRAAVALATGGLTIVSWFAWAVEFRDAPPLEPWVPWTIGALCAVSTAALALGAMSVTRSAGPRAISTGPAGDVFDDIALSSRARAHPWAFALCFAGFVAALAFGLGWTEEGDPGSGIVRGVFEGVAVLACFAVLGRRLALRR